MSTPPASDLPERSQTVAVDQPPRPASRPRLDPSELLSRLWQQNLPVMRERVTGLERAAQQAASGTLSPEARISASDIAHKLAGSLGMFGYPKGTEIAREIEHLLESEGDPDPAQLFALGQQLRSVLAL